MAGGNTPNLVLKRMQGHFLKIPPLKKLLEFQDWKKDYKAYTKKKISNQKLNQWFKWDLSTRKKKQEEGVKLHVNIR